MTNIRNGYAGRFIIARYVKITSTQGKNITMAGMAAGFTPIALKDCELIVKERKTIK
jgi:hypothetical protein